MAEIARRSGVGSATLYRNFATRRDLLEALLVDEVDEVCAAAATVEGDSPGDRLTTWLRRFFQYVTTKRPVVMGLLEHTDKTDPVFQTRGRMLAAGRPLLSAAQDAHEIAGDIDLDQILDLVMAIAKIPGSRSSTRHSPGCASAAPDVHTARNPPCTGADPDEPRRPIEVPGPLRDHHS
ncbi:TetR/AcrR family transcriptional regulator [Amycolatopsis sp. RTGN1]|uniref:TetR/AcrR family transcriptional regulator n=1 Tax=Amycolatopsis ponsaeliensis TaxID=2992142 RepID=UPI00255137CD|nr:TetR/AcrR family transcriptional regulator [Amycolatopsis sp. RTGN1]